MYFAFPLASLQLIILWLGSSVDAQVVCAYICDMMGCASAPVTATLALIPDTHRRGVLPVQFSPKIFLSTRVSRKLKVSFESG